MHRVLLAAATVLLSAQVLGATVNIYGRIDIGGLPQPPVLVLPEPVIVQRGPAYVEREPVYLHVPPGHRKHWSKHCMEYNACGQRVYFVQDDWYDRVYVPERQRHGDSRFERGDDRREERRDDRRYDDHGGGGDHGHGNGKGHKGRD